MKFALVWVGLMSAMAACAPTTATTAPTTTSTTTTTAAAATTIPTTAVATTATGDANVLSASTFRVPFSLEPPSDQWRVTFAAADGALEITGGPTRLLVFTAVGAASVQEWIEFFTTNESIVATEPEAVELGSAPGFVLDLQLAEGSAASEPGCQTPCLLIFAYAPSPEANLSWILVPDAPNRAWVVDVGGRPVAIFAETTVNGFEEWVAEVEAGLATLQWSVDS